MKLNFTLFSRKTSTFFAIILLSLFPAFANGQISVVCTNPTNTAYGLTGNGEIYELNSTNAATIKVIKNNSYLGNSPSNSNGLGYNSVNGCFYYFKRNVTSAPQEFVSFNPTLNLVTILATSTATDDIHTGCVSFNGKGYYTIDIQGTMHYYDIVNNKWTFITSKIVDQSGNNITNLIKVQNAGDLAIDGYGNLWLLTSSSTNYGLYKFPANLPTTPVAQVNVVCAINPTATTPTGNSFAGIAFKPNGQVLMATKNDNRLYLLQTTNTLSFVGTFTTSDVGNDLTACAFPAAILPVSWKNFNASVEKENMVSLNWEVIESSETKGYYVQYSSNSTDWTDISFINAKNNLEATSSYAFTHINNANGRQYYRLKQVDSDGKFGYSEIVTVNLFNDKKGVNVWPNPATTQVTIEGYNTAGENFSKAQVFDFSGRKITEMTMHAGQNSINVSKLPAGTYLIKVQTMDGSTYTQKLVKQ